MYTKRQKQIISLLLEQELPVSGKKLAAIAGITDRTIRNDITAINSTSEAQIRSSSSGYFIQDREYFLKTIKDEKGDAYDSETTRELFFLFQLLWLETPITIDELTETSYFSRTTVVRILQKMETDWLKDSPIEGVYGRKGIQLIGKESDKRDLIGRALFLSYENGDISALKEILLQFQILKNEDFVWLYDHFLNCFANQNIILTDRGIYLFTMEVLILMNRLQNGFWLEPDYPVIPSSLDLAWNKLAKKFQVTITEQDRSYIASRVALRGQFTMNTNENIPADAVIAAFIRELSDHYGIPVDAMEPYRSGLESHLRAMINRLQSHMASNPILVNEIKLMYPYAFECASAIIPILKTQMNLDITESEIGYIAVHLAVILEELKKPLKALILCGSGVGTGILVKKRLDMFFQNNLITIGPYPVYQADHILEQQPDIDVIFSTIPLSKKSVPVLQISPVFSQTDFLRINTWLSEHQNRNQPAGTDIRKQNFVIFPEETSHDEILHTLADCLVKAGCIEDAESFVSSIKERDALYSTMYGKIWLPHPVKTMAVKTGIACAVLKKNPDIDLVFMLAVRREDTELFDHFYQNILVLIDSPDKLSQLKNVSSYEEFMKSYNQL